MKKIIENELDSLKEKKKIAEANVIDAVSRNKEPNEKDKYNLIVYTSNVYLLEILIDRHTYVNRNRQKKK